MGHVHGGSQGPFLLESRMRFPSGFESALGVDRLAMLAIVETRLAMLASMLSSWLQHRTVWNSFAEHSVTYKANH